jgi:hypothetical protein
LPSWRTMRERVLAQARVIQCRFFPPPASASRGEAARKPRSRTVSESSGISSHISRAKLSSLLAYGPKRTAASRWLRSAISVTKRTDGSALSPRAER